MQRCVHSKIAIINHSFQKLVQANLDCTTCDLPLGTSSGSLTAILCFSSVVKPAFCVVSATLNVVGTAMLGIHLPVSWWILYAIAFAESIGEPPPIEIKTSHPDFDISAVASRISWIGLLMCQMRNYAVRTSAYACCPILLNVPPCADPNDFSMFLMTGVFSYNERPVMMKPLVPPSSAITSESWLLVPETFLVSENILEEAQLPFP